LVGWFESFKQAEVIEPPADYDTSWKEALQQYFEPFLTFCFTEVHTLIDWSRQPQSLDKELEQIVREAESGERIADKLFKVWIRDGEEAWVLIHVEVQSQEESDFAKRMYQEERQMPLLSRMELRAMQAGIEQGALQNARESVVEVLEIRFEVVPPELIEAINEIDDTSFLKELHRQAIALDSLEAFQEFLSQREAETSED